MAYGQNLWCSPSCVQCGRVGREYADKQYAAMLYLSYHFATCERADLLGVTSHALDIFRK